MSATRPGAGAVRLGPRGRPTDLGCGYLLQIGSFDPVECLGHAVWAWQVSTFGGDAMEWRACGPHRSALHGDLVALFPGVAGPYDVRDGVLARVATAVAEYQASPESLRA